MAEFEYGNIICESIEDHVYAMYVGPCRHRSLLTAAPVVLPLEALADIVWLNEDPPRQEHVDIRPWELCTHMVDEDGNLPNVVTVTSVDASSFHNAKVYPASGVIVINKPVSSSTEITLEWDET